MNEQPTFYLERYTFDKNVLEKVKNDQFVKNLWPLVYILSDEKSKVAYVGETTDGVSRITTHLKNDEKKKLSVIRLVTSDSFNKSATLDIESNLIKYISGEGKYELLNGNLGIANHNYFQKNEIYWDIFKSLWKKLIEEKIVTKTLQHIDNTDIFKYSPYKGLFPEQKTSIINILKSILKDNIENIVVEGGAGTGKSILGIFLFKLLNSKQEELNLKDFGEEEKELVELVEKVKEKIPNPKMALVIPMAGFRATLKESFKNIRGLQTNMVIGPAELAEEKYDIVIVDESHRLRKRTNLGAYFGAFDKVNKKLGLSKKEGNELDWVQMQPGKKILFYDAEQSIKPSDVMKGNFSRIFSKKSTFVEKLKSQFRVKGGVDYISYVDKLLNTSFRKEDHIFTANEYDFELYEDLGEMIKKIKEKNSQVGLARLIAGYAWEWIGKKDKTKYDIEIDGISLRWNSVSSKWIGSKFAEDEVGCIHTTQGYDLNYAGIIFGHEIGYNKEKNEIVIYKDKYKDRNGVHPDLDPKDLKKYIINIYKTIMFRGIKGTYVYVCDPDLREYFTKHIKTIYKRKEVIRKAKLIASPYEGVKIPILGTAPCGNPFYGEENIEGYIDVPKDKIKNGAKYFVLYASGDSMNEAGINDGDLVLCRSNEKAETGDHVVALLGGENVTIKYYDKKDGRRILVPKSSNKEHKIIMPEEGDSVQGIVQEVL